jgi:hypothetical protein
VVASPPPTELATVDETRNAVEALSERELRGLATLFVMRHHLSRSDDPEWYARWIQADEDFDS